MPIYPTRRKTYLTIRNTSRGRMISENGGCEDEVKHPVGGGWGNG